MNDETPIFGMRKEGTPWDDYLGKCIRMDSKLVNIVCVGYLEDVVEGDFRLNPYAKSNPVENSEGKIEWRMAVVNPEIAMRVPYSRDFIIEVVDESYPEKYCKSINQQRELE